LENPNPVLAQAIGVPIIPKHILDGQDVNKAPYNQKPIGFGSFKVAEWKSGESVTLEANSTYFKGAPYLDKWIFRIIPNQDAVVVALQSGEVDFANVRGKDVPRFLGNPKYNVVTAPVDLARYIMLNQAKPQFQDKRVRQALSMSLDRNAIVDAAEQGYGVVADSHFNQPVSVYKAGKLAVPKQDFTKAKALMAEAGWVDTNNDGIVEKDGKPFKITLEYNPGWTFMSPVASLIQAWWKQIGVDVTIRTYDSASFTTKVFRSSDLDKPYDAVLNGWGFYGTEANSYAAYYAPTSQGASPFNYQNAEIKALFDKARASLDEKERATLYEQAEKLMWDDLPMIPMYYPVRIFVHSSRVALDEAVLDTSRFLPFLYPEKVYIRK
jgi:peptide/nickel transport system substrate-binding protein